MQPASTGGSSPVSTAPSTVPSAPVFSGSPYPMSPKGWVFPLYPLSRVAPRSWWSLDQGVDWAATPTSAARGWSSSRSHRERSSTRASKASGATRPCSQVEGGPDDGRYVYYGHAAPALVPVGTKVSAGQPIADVGCGHVGISSAPHLEIGILPEGAKNPLEMPSFGETSHEALSNLLSAYKTAVADAKARAAAKRAAARKSAAARH